jgi:HEAT repeat protein
VLEWVAVSGTRRLPDAVARRRAVATAGHTGDLAAVRAALADDDASVRGAALGALVRLGAATADDLQAALRDADASLRRRAAEEAARSPVGTDVRAELVALLADEDAAVAESAAFALGEVQPPPGGAVQALAATATSHAEVLVREAAVAALGSIGDDTGRDAVLRACDDVATVRRRAVLALAAFEGPEVEATLQRLSSDRDRQVRQAAEDLLHGWGTSE